MNGFSNALMQTSDNWCSIKFAPIYNFLMHRLITTSSLYISTYSWGPVLLHFTLRTALFKIQGCQNVEKLSIHPMTSKYLWTQFKVPYTLICPRALNGSVLLYDQLFLRYTVVEMLYDEIHGCRKSEGTVWHQSDHNKHLHFKSTLHILNTCPGTMFKPTFHSVFRFYDQRFKIQGFLNIEKIENAPNNLISEWLWKTGIFKIQGFSKIGKIWNDLEHLALQTSLYTLVS